MQMLNWESGEAILDFSHLLHPQLDFLSNCDSNMHLWECHRFP
jgi:hypothetical protein